MKQKPTALARNALLLLLCTLLLIASAYADTGPKNSLTIQVVNAPEGVLYLDLLAEGEPSSNLYYNFTQEDEAKYDPAVLSRLHSLEGDGWVLAYLTGVANRAPLFGDLAPNKSGSWHFYYVGLPKTFRIAAATADSAQAAETPYTRREFYTNLVYDWETNTVSEATPSALRFLARLLTTLIPTLVIEGALLWLFGFREMRSWAVFFLVNLITQVGLHIACGSMVLQAGWHAMSYFLMFLIPELVIWVAEAVAYRLLFREHSAGRRVGYAVCANAASFIIGYLPVSLLYDFLRSL